MIFYQNCETNNRVLHNLTIYNTRRIHTWNNALDNLSIGTCPVLQKTACF